MAAVCQAIFLIVVCGLVQCKGNACNITCTTDYIKTLNCSTSASAGPVSCDVEAVCWDEIESVNGSCVIRPPHQWCLIQDDRLRLMTNPDTKCTLKGKQTGQQQEVQEYISEVHLGRIIKPRQPYNLTLTKHNGNFNLSWDTVYKLEGGEDSELEGELMYRVRLRPKDDLDEKQYKDFYIRDDRRYQEIRCELFLPGREYVASVQASVNSDSLPQSMWSEWSTSSEWTCPYNDSSDLTRPNRYLWLLLLLVGLLFVLLCFFGKQRGLQKLRLFQYIPDPQAFFKPLYHTYQGDFKKWVGPVHTYNMFDILEKSVPLQVLSEKQLASLPLQELLHEPGNNGSGNGDWSLLSLVNLSSSKRYFFGGSSLSTTRSSDHISMDTVTVSGQEGTMLDWAGGSGRNRPDPSLHGAGQRAPGVSDENDVPELEGRSLEEQGFDDWQLQANDMDNIEEISLDSYSSIDNSDDGYPQMGLDLDTIDSGFLESDCSSPMNSECDGGEQRDAPLLGDGVAAHSNYVKQWVDFVPMPEENNTSEQ